MNLSLNLCLAVILPTAPDKVDTLYGRIDPTSISQHLALYELYPAHPAGQRALSDAWKLITGNESTVFPSRDLPFTPSIVSALVGLINKKGSEALPNLSDEELQLIERFSQHLSHTRLKGHYLWSEVDIQALSPDQVDLARGLFVAQFGEDRHQIRTYEAMLDMMAIQILARLKADATPEDKIRVMNELIFDEFGFRFPPHSLFQKEIDSYTMLPSILDSRRGVCLGVSILYLCLAQRLNFDLEIITPPGHIYVRYRTPDKTINIETTARGIHMDDDVYLSFSLKKLQQSNMKEVIGHAYVNQAAVCWRQKHYQDALKLYEKAVPYLANDFHIKELLGYMLLLCEQPEKGKELLSQLHNDPSDFSIGTHDIADDYLNGNVDAAGIEALFTTPEEDRASLLAYKDQLKAVIDRCPNFRSGLVQLGIIWIKLGRIREALPLLQRAAALDPNEPDTASYLVLLHMEQQNYPQAWSAFHQLETILREHNHTPKQLRELRRQLAEASPE